MNYRILIGFFTSLLVYVGVPDGAGVSFKVLLYLPMALVNFSADYPFGFAAISMASHAVAILMASLKPASTYPGVILIPHVFASLMLLLLSQSKFPTLLTASFSLSFTVWGVCKWEKSSALPP